MNYKKILIVTFILLAILSVGAVSASEDMDVPAHDSDVIVSQDSTIDDNNLAAANDDIILSNSSDEQENNPFFSTSPGPVDPDEETGIGLVLQYETDGTIEVVDLNKTTTIIENLNISNINPIYLDEGMEYRIPSEEFNFNEIENGDVLSFRFQGDDGSSCEDFFTFVDNQDGTIHFDSFGPYFVISDIINVSNPVVATLMIPSIPGVGSPLFTGKISVWSRMGNHYRQQITEDNATVIHIDKSDIDDFYLLEDGSKIVFDFVDDDGELIISETRVLTYDNDGNIILEESAEDENDFIIILMDSNVIDNDTVLIIPEDQIPVDVDEFAIIIMVEGNERKTTWSINNLTLGVNGYEWTTDELFINELMENIYPFCDIDVYVQCYRNGEEAEQVFGNVRVYNTPFIANGELSLIDNGRVIAFAFFPEGVHDEFNVEIWKNGNLYPIVKEFKISEMDQYQEDDEYRGYYIHISDLEINESGEYNVTVIFIKSLGENVEYIICYNGEFSVVPFSIEFYVQEGEVVEDMTGPLCSIDLPEDSEGNVTVKVDGNKVFESTLEEIEYDVYGWGLSYYVILNSLNITESGDYNIEVTVETADWGTRTAEDTISFNVTENIFEFRDSIYGEFILDKQIGTAISRDSEIILYLNGNKAATGRMDDDLYFEFNENFADIYGSLKPGEYEAILEIDGKNVAEGTFEVKDTSGNVDVDVTNDKGNVSVYFKAPMPSYDNFDSYALDIYVDSANPYYLHGADEPFIYFMYDDLEELLDNNTHAIELGELEPGEHIVLVAYSTYLDYPLDEQDFFVRIYNITVDSELLVTKLIASEVTATYNAEDYFLAYLTDSNDNPIYNATVVAYIDDLQVVNYTDELGCAEFSTRGVSPGNYSVLIVFEGNENYEASNATANVEIVKAKTKMTATNVTAAYNSNDSFLVYMNDSNGQPVCGVAVATYFDDFYVVAYTDEIGWAEVCVRGLKPGNYTPLVVFEGNENYTYSTTTANVEVVKADTIITLKYEDRILTANLTDAEGKGISNVKVGFANNGVTYIVTDENGLAKYSTESLAVGNYTIQVAFFGDDNYNPSEKENITIVIPKIATKLVSADVSVISGREEYLVANLTDVDGNPISGAKVGFANNGVKYVYTDENGQAKYSTSGLSEGTYTVKMAYYGNATYLASNSVTAKITVGGKIATKLVSADVSVVCGKEGYLVANLTDVDGNPISGAKVGFANNGVKYVYTDDNGQAKYSTSGLDEGTYTVKMAYYGNATYLASNSVTAKITVGGKVATKLVSADVSVVCGKEGYLVANLTDVDGNPISGAKVGFANNGVKYVYTDDNGQAKYSTSGLDEGTYTVKMAYYGNATYSASNSVTAKITVGGKVATKLSSKDVTVNYHADGYLIATLKDANGNPISGAKVGFANNGVKYVYTDDNGQAKYSTSGLDEGTYTVKMAYYGNATYSASNSVTAKITVLGRMPTKLSSSDVHVLYDEDGYLVATLKDANGNPIKGAKVGFANNGVKYVFTDENGQAKYSTKGLSEGTYSVKMTYYGNDTYAASNSVSAKIYVGKYVTPSLTSNGVTTTYGANDYLVVTLTGMNNEPIVGAKILFLVFGKKIIDVTDSSGHAKISTKGYNPGIYNVVFKYAGTSLYSNVTSSAKMVVKKA